MDRRHCLLAIGVIASVGTEPEEGFHPTNYLFDGFQLLPPVAITLDEKRPERAWRITAELVLPS
jgi:hypothetical protein